MLTHGPARPHQDLPHLQPGLQRALLVERRERGSEPEISQEPLQDPVGVGLSQNSQTCRQFTVSPSAELAVSGSGGRAVTLDG